MADRGRRRDAHPHSDLVDSGLWWIARTRPSGEVVVSSPSRHPMEDGWGGETNSKVSAEVLEEQSWVRRRYDLAGDDPCSSESMATTIGSDPRWGRSGSQSGVPSSRSPSYPLISNNQIEGADYCVVTSERSSMNHELSIGNLQVPRIRDRYDDTTIRRYGISAR